MFKDFHSIPILIVGAGNVAWHLGKAFKNAGLPIAQVWSRQILHAEELANEISVKATDDVEEVNRFNGVIVFCIPDHAIPDFTSRLENSDSIYIHTSGSLNISVFEKRLIHRGVFYPLQTFRKNKPYREFKDIPVLIESSTSQVDSMLHFWASAIQSKVYEIDSFQRMKIHVAAVFACNFSNHMVSISRQIIEENNHDYEMLRPLLTETLTNILKFDTREIQTGPAIRKDMDTIDKHSESLAEHPEWADLYSLISKSIIKMHFDK